MATLPLDVTPPPVTAPPSGEDERRDLVSAIPIAHPGDIIAPDHHNTLRAAIAYLARSAASEATAGPTTTKSFFPFMWPVQDQKPSAGSSVPEWRVSVINTRPTVANQQGWMPLELPDGTDIDAMIVHGDQGSDDDSHSWTFYLHRITLTGGSGRAATLLGSKALDPPPTGGGAIDGGTQPDTSFVLTVPVGTQKTSAADLADLRRVDTSKYRYIFYTQLAGAENPDALAIDLVQINCLRPAA